ncbi:MAG: type IV pili methyl-accepting chemotaxis transducer N-terminal domain-containing protein [Gammaproteobacteria bacterium]
MRKLSSLLATSLVGAMLLVTAPVQAQVNSIIEAVDQAGVQRMLSQRILKTYGLVVLNVKVSEHQKQLTESVKQYENILSDLQGFSGTEQEAKELMNTVRAQWEPVKRLASAPPTLEKVSELHHATDDLLAANEELVHELARETHSDAGHVVDISERQQMLSQRIAALYNLHALGVDEESFREQLDNATFEFMLGLEELIGYEGNTRSVNAALKKAKTQFRMLEFSVNKEGTTYFPFVVSEAAKKILIGMHDVTQEYLETAKIGS